MSKKKIFILFWGLILVLILGAALYFKFGHLLKPIPKTKEKPKLEEKFPSERAGKYSVSGGEVPGPAFEKELIVDPEEPKLGEIQKFSIWARDPKGIKEVRGEVTTDSGKEIIKFELVEGDKKEGRWFGSWQVKDVSPKKHYTTSLLAINEEGKNTILNFPWQLGE